MSLSEHIASLIGKPLMIVNHEKQAFAGTLSKVLDDQALVLTAPHSIDWWSAEKSATSVVGIGGTELIVFVSSIAYIAQPEWINDGPWAVKKEN